MARKIREGGKSTRRDARPLTFNPDPGHLIAAVEHLDTILGAVRPTAPGVPPSHAFRVLRPADLCVFDVRGYRLRMETSESGPVLVPDAADARLEVNLSFQHLGERAFFRSIPPKPTDESLDPPPIQALAARPSRLVFDVPEGESIGYSVAGVLAAISRLPLRVAPLATPRVVRVSPEVFVPGAFTNLATLAGGFQLVRHTDGLLAVMSMDAVPRPAGPPSAKSLAAQAQALRTARLVLAGETAVDLSTRPTRRGALSSPATVTSATAIGGARPRPRALGDLFVLPPVFPVPAERPRAPRADETAIEAPFRLIISPSNLGGFAHATEPVAPPEDDSRIELWHSRLGVRKVDPDDGAVTIDESRHSQRIIRAIWARDKMALGPDADAPPGELPFRMSLNPRDRVVLVRQSADPKITPPVPVDVDRLYLSSLGAYLDLHGRWTTKPYTSEPHNLQGILAWDHEAPMGRDQFVRVVYPGYFFPIGHRATIIKITERRMPDAANPYGYLFQRKFVACTQPVRTYDDRRMPFKQIAIRPLETPDIRDPLLPTTPDAPQGEQLFWPVVDNGKFYFTLDCIDWNGKPVPLPAPLLFVAEQLPTDLPGQSAADIRNEYVNDPEHAIAASGQLIAYAESVTPGDSAFESVTLRFDGTPGPAGSGTSTPFLGEADIVVPAMRHLAPTSPQTTVKYAAPYLNEGFGGKNAEPQVVFELKTAATISFGASTDKAGGFVQPDLPVRGLSRTLGAVGDLDDLVNEPTLKFNPEKYLAGVLPKLFGLFDLVEILEKVGLGGAPKFITEQLDRVSAMLADLDALKGAVATSVARLAEDAAGAATTKLQQQAEDARAALDAIRGQIEARVDELATALQALLALDTPSSVGDVTAAVSGLLTAIAAQVTALRDVVNTRPLPPQVKADIERLINAVEPALDAAEVVATIDAITQFVNGLDPEGLGIRASFEWKPTLTNFPKGPDEDALFIVRPDGFRLSVEARASGSDGVGADVLAELREFSLQLFPTAPLMRLAFDRIAFRAASGRKPEVDVVFRGIEFVGVLSFIETLKDMIPFDAFSDPPYVDVSADGVTAGFNLGLPAVAVGVFSLENISLGADARIPFLGNEALTIGFNFCTREKPFRLTVMMIGGGGFVGIRLSPRGLVLLEMSLEAGACLSINLGVASGSVSIMVGVYLRLEADAGSLTGYFRIRGEVDVLGLITASITLELSLTYEFATGKLVGRASIEIEVEVFFFSFSVTVSCERRLAGSNGDPTFEQVIGLLPDGTSPAWSAYCAAFAEA
jgi:hypothetical protein